ncbi:MAG: hypothetical protein CMJ23_01750 [Phycisphaerae bacterium]|nr:hypothetical protein [Phycisphaerae bacterium]
MCISDPRLLTTAGRHAGILLILILVSVISARATAQGTNGMVPDPMGIREATELISRHVDLGPEERLAIEKAHDRYLEAFESLRDDEIEAFLRMNMEVEAASVGSMPSAPVLARFFRAWNDVVERVGVIDDRFFDDLLPAFDDSNGDGIQRARRVRDRLRYGSSVGGFNSNRFADVDQCFWESDPTEAEIEAVDEILRGYESAMPRLTEGVAEASVGMMMLLVEEITARGFGELSEEDMSDPAKMEAFMAAFGDAMTVASEPLVEAMVGFNDRRLRGARQLGSLLDADRWWEIKRRWLSAILPFFQSVSREKSSDRVPEFAEEVAKALTPDSPTSVSVTAILNGWYDKDDRITDELIEAGMGDQMGRLGAVIFMAEENGSLTGEIMERRSRSSESAVGALLALLPDEAARAAVRKNISKRPYSIMQSGEILPIITSSETATPTKWESDARVARSVSHVPAPISLEDMDLFAELLGIEESEREILASLHDDYLDAWRREVNAKIQGDGSGSTSKAFWDRLSAGLDAALEVDEELFINLETALVDLDSPLGLEAVRVQRGFDRMSSISGYSFDSAFGLPVIEAVSPYRLFLEIGQPLEDRGEILAELMEKASALKPAITGWERRRYEADRNRHEREQALNLALRGELASGEPTKIEPGDLGDFIALQKEMMALNLGVFKTRRDEAARLRSLVDETLEASVMPRLPALAALEMRLAMLDAGWAGTRREDSTLDIARQIFSMKDLGDDQKAILESMLLGHLETEVEMVEAMAKRIESMIETPMQDDLFSLEMNVSGETAKYRFRRGELLERLLQKLLVILTVEQVERVPSLRERR